MDRQIIVMKKILTLLSFTLACASVFGAAGDVIIKQINPSGTAIVDRILANPSAIRVYGLNSNSGTWQPTQFIIGPSLAISGAFGSQTLDAVQDIRSSASPVFLGINLAGNVSINEFGGTSGIYILTSGASTDARLRVENGRSAHTSNSSQIDFAMNTDSAARSAGTIVSSFLNISDAARTSSMLFAVTEAGSLATRMTLTGTGINSTAIGLTTPSTGSFTTLTLGSATLLTTTVSLTNGAGASLGTLANSPVAGNPTKWIPIVDNGTTRYIPAW